MRSTAASTSCASRRSAGPRPTSTPRSASSSSTPKAASFGSTRRSARIVGGTREELLTWRLQGRTHPDDRDVDDELYRRQVAGDIGFYSIEKRFIRKDGRVIWIAVRSSTVRDRRRALPLRRASGSGRHRAQRGRGAPEAPDRRTQPSRQEHAGDGAVAGDADSARDRIPPKISARPSRAA